MAKPRKDKMNELIEKLKKNEKPFGLLGEEEKCFIKKVGIKNCEVFTALGWKSTGLDKFLFTSIFRIKPDYQPEPEYEDKEIRIINIDGDDLLGISYVTGIKKAHWKLHEIPSMPNFEGFYANPNELDDNIVNIEQVARELKKDKKVIARFRTGNDQDGF